MRLSDTFESTGSREDCDRQVRIRVRDWVGVYFIFYIFFLSFD